MVEEAVIGEIRRLLRMPEIIARTARKLKNERPDLNEGTVTAALTQFDDLWKALIPAEQARVVQLLVGRVTVGEVGLERLVVRRAPCAISLYDLCFVASLPWEEQVVKVFE